MRNLCQIFCEKTKNISTFALLLCLLCGLTPPAESISVKLKGKIVLGGILSGLAVVTSALVTHDKRTAAKRQPHLGPPDRVIQFEHGFDRWRINAYGEQCYLFRNNRFIRTVPCASLPANFSRKRQVLEKPFLIDTPVSGRPMWLQLYPLRPQRAPQFVSSDLYRLADARLLVPQLSPSH